MCREATLLINIPNKQTIQLAPYMMSHNMYGSIYIRVASRSSVQDDGGRGQKITYNTPVLPNSLSLRSLGFSQISRGAEQGLALKWIAKRCNIFSHSHKYFSFFLSNFLHVTDFVNLHVKPLTLKAPCTLSLGKNNQESIISNINCTFITFYLDI